jgi:hypothetical protein
MNRPILFGAVCAAALNGPLAASAQTGSEGFYTPPKMIKQGKSETPISGSGKVLVKVLVKPDGSFQVEQVVTSTNHGDDAAALEIAKSSTYAPATRGGKKVIAFYDYALKFTTAGATSNDAAGATGLGQYDAELRAGNYTAAQTGLKSYLAAHPDDARAELDLGVADTFLNDSEGAADAFDKAGTIPDSFKAVAGKAYVDRAVQLLGAKDSAGALAIAKRAVALEPGFSSYDTQGVAEFESGDTAAAVADLVKSHDIAKTLAAVPAQSRAANDLHLMQAYLASDNVDAAEKVASEAAAADPSAKAYGEKVFASYYIKKAQDAEAAGKFEQAAGFYERGVTDAPSQAALLYAGASVAYMKVVPNPDVDKAKASADKGLAADANSPEANYAEGVALANQGKKAEALPFLNKADTLAKAAGESALATSAEGAIKQLTTVK